MKVKAQIEVELSEKERLLKNMKESLSSDLTAEEVQQHPAVIAQEYYKKALEWVLQDKDKNSDVTQ